METEKEIMSKEWRKHLKKKPKTRKDDLKIFIERFFTRCTVNCLSIVLWIKDQNETKNSLTIFFLFLFWSG